MRKVLGGLQDLIWCTPALSGAQIVCVRVRRTAHKARLPYAIFLRPELARAHEPAPCTA